MRSKIKKHDKKRHGVHQKRTKRFTKVYTPYLPLLLVVVFSIVSGSLRPLGSTLAYATSMSNGSLLSATNSHRSSNGKAALVLNEKLSIAAQAKVNDMVSRNYWSHNTPEGQEPWVFIDNTGYGYLKAGENLAYGFSTSEETVVGWMNSASHKANMLDGEFTEAGFGYANAESFNDSGQQTVVVAMYAKPQTLASTTTAELPESQTPAPADVQPAAEPAANETQVPAPTVKAPEPTAQPTNTDISITADVAPQEITRAQTLTNGHAPWTVSAAVLVVSSTLIFALLRHSWSLRHLLRDSKRYVLHHPWIDTTLISLVLIGLILLQSAGTIL